jgi:hypothetical protein
MKLARNLFALSLISASSLAGPAFANIPSASDPAGSGVIVSVWDTTKNVSVAQYLGFQNQNASGLALGSQWQLTDWSALNGSSTSNLRSVCRRLGPLR